MASNRPRPEMAEWQFLLGENTDPKVATYLKKDALFAEHVRDVLGQGVDDEDDVLPYAREHGLVVVPSDVEDFGSRSSGTHTGVVLLYDDTMPAYRVASALITMVGAYPSRDEFPGREELDARA